MPTLTQACEHDISDQDVAAHCDGLCPLCLQSANERLRYALKLALAMLAPHEPKDSRAVSDEFVAMAAIEAGETSKQPVGIIQRALARLK